MKGYFLTFKKKGNFGGYTVKETRTSTASKREVVARYLEELSADVCELKFWKQYENGNEKDITKKVNEFLFN